MNIIEAFQALEEGKRVQDQDGDEIVLRENNVLYFKEEDITDDGRVPMIKYNLQEDSFSLIEEHVPYIIQKESDLHSFVAGSSSTKNFIYIDTLKEINENINTDESIIRLYKQNGFNFEARDNGDCYEIFLTYNQEE